MIFRDIFKRRRHLLSWSSWEILFHFQTFLGHFQPQATRIAGSECQVTNCSKRVQSEIQVLTARVNKFSRYRSLSQKMLRFGHVTTKLKDNSYAIKNPISKLLFGNDELWLQRSKWSNSPVFTRSTVKLQTPILALLYDMQ